MSAEPEPAGEIRNRDEPLEHRSVDPVRRRLEVLPGEEHPHGVETAGGDPRKVGCNLGQIEVRPPAHRGARRPVVDADPERLPGRRSAQRTPLCRSLRAVELHDAPIEGEVVVHHPLDVEAPFDRCAHGCAVERARSADGGNGLVRGSRRGSRSRRRRTISAIEPRRRAMTGVPQAIASTTLKPNGSSKLTRCSSARAPPSRPPRRSGRPGRRSSPAPRRAAAPRAARSSRGPG